jgi:hypothetical protein
MIFNLLLSYSIDRVPQLHELFGANLCFAACIHCELFGANLGCHLPAMCRGSTPPIGRPTFEATSSNRHQAPRPVVWSPPRSRTKMSREVRDAQPPHCPCGRPDFRRRAVAAARRVERRDVGAAAWWFRSLEPPIPRRRGEIIQPYVLYHF